MTNTRQRSNEIQEAAMKQVASVGIAILDAIPAESVRFVLADLQKRLMAEVGTDRVTARKHIAKAVRRQRFPGWTPTDNWGGNRRGTHHHPPPPTPGQSWQPGAQRT